MTSLLAPCVIARSRSERSVARLGEGYDIVCGCVCHLYHMCVSQMLLWIRYV